MSDLFGGDSVLTEGEAIRRIQGSRHCDDHEAAKTWQWLKIVGAVESRPGLGWCEVTAEE